MFYEYRRCARKMMENLKRIFLIKKKLLKYYIQGEKRMDEEWV